MDWRTPSQRTKGPELLATLQRIENRGAWNGAQDAGLLGQISDMLSPREGQSVTRQQI